MTKLSKTRKEVKGEAKRLAAAVLERTASSASLASEMDAEEGQFAAPWATPRVGRRTLSPPKDETKLSKTREEVKGEAKRLAAAVANRVSPTAAAGGGGGGGGDGGGGAPVVVAVLGAEGLPEVTGLWGPKKCDSFVRFSVVELLDEDQSNKTLRHLEGRVTKTGEQQTQPIHGCRNPTWNQLFLLQDHPYQDYSRLGLQLTVLSHNSFRDPDIIGSALLKSEQTDKPSVIVQSWHLTISVKQLGDLDKEEELEIAIKNTATNIFGAKSIKEVGKLHMLVSTEVILQRNFIENGMIISELMIEKLKQEVAEMKKRPIHLAEEEKRARQREDARRRKLLFLAHVRTEQERLEAEQRAEEERLLALERAEQERLEAERCAEEERLALENAERERLEAERRAEEEWLLDRAEDEEVWAELPRDAAPALRAAVAATALDRDAACKQLLVANRAELYHIFKCYMDRLTKAASRPTLQLFAVHFGFVPTHFTRRALDGVLGHLVAAVNARKAARARARARRPSRATGAQMENGDEAPLDSNTCPLSYINFLSLLVLMAHFGRDDDRNESLAESLSRLLTFMDNSDGKSKMGGTSKRNSYSSGRMAYLDSPKLPDKEAALNFGIYRWYCDTHAQQWKGGSPSNKEALQFRTKSSPSIIRRSSLSVFGSERSLSSAASKSTRSPVSPAPTANHGSSFQGIKARKNPVDLHKLQRAGSDGSLTVAPCSDIIWEISHTSSKRNAAPGKGQNSNGGKQLQPEVGADNTS